MKKNSSQWKIETLAKRYSRINFPEYQREPNVWSRSAKQRLIDSIVRQFDIASIYLYRDKDDDWDCIDGRQRLGAIMSFLSQNPTDEDDGYVYKRMNEIFDEEERPFVALEGLRWNAIKARAREEDPVAKRFVERVKGYEFTVVELSGSRQPEEFNLQFTRLNLGTIINSGEKLHAMVGELRDVCFYDIGRHPFLRETSIQTRRYAQEQVAAQLLAQVFSVGDENGYTRTRHFDLQRFFKRHTTLDDRHKVWIEEVRSVLDLLHEAFDDVSVLRNRALTVSTVLLAWELKIEDGETAKEFGRFVAEFICRLQWQMRKGLDIDLPYRYLADFQRYVAQASVERPAVEGRAAMLREGYERWMEEGRIGGDEEYEGNPAAECRGEAP